MAGGIAALDDYRTRRFRETTFLSSVGIDQASPYSAWPTPSDMLALALGAWRMERTGRFTAMSKSAVCPECKIRPVEAGHYVCAECEAAVGIANGGYPPPTDTPLPADQHRRFHHRRALPVWARATIVFALVLLGLAIAFEAVLIVSGVNTPPFMVKVKAGMNSISQRADDISRRLYDALR